MDWRPVKNWLLRVTPALERKESKGIVPGINLELSKRHFRV